MPAPFAEVRRQIRKRIHVLQDALVVLDRVEAIRDEPEPLAEEARALAREAFGKHGGRRMRTNRASAGTWGDAIDAAFLEAGGPLTPPELVDRLRANGRVFPIGNKASAVVGGILHTKGHKRGWVKVGAAWQKVPKQEVLSSGSAAAVQEPASTS